MGFLTLGERFNGNINDIINDRIDVVTKGFLGLTVTCARCHDHKFDPIPTKDYYSLHGIFASSAEPTEKPLLSALKVTPDYQDFSTKYNALEKAVGGVATRPRSGKNKNKSKETPPEANRVKNGNGPVGIDASRSATARDGPDGQSQAERFACFYPG